MIENKTVYTSDLLFRMQWLHLAGGRRKVLILISVTFVLAIVLIVNGVLVEHSPNEYIGTFFLTADLILLCVLFQNRKSKIRRIADRNMRENPDKVLEYRFAEDHIAVNQMGARFRATYQIDYSYIGKTVKMDSKACYFIVRNNISFVVYEEQGIDTIYAYICSKTGQEPHK